MGFWIAPGNPIESPVTPANTGRGGDRESDETPETMVAPLHPLNPIKANTSGSFAPFTKDGKPVYARPDRDDEKTRKRTSPVGMEYFTRPRYVNGDPLIQRNDNQGFKARGKLNYSEWCVRHELRCVSETFNPDENPPIGLTGRGTGRVPKGMKFSDFERKKLEPGKLTRKDSRRMASLDKSTATRFARDEIERRSGEHAPPSGLVGRSPLKLKKGPQDV